jgi:hypothetical protein
MDTNKQKEYEKVVHELFHARVNSSYTNLLNLLMKCDKILDLIKK